MIVTAYGIIVFQLFERIAIEKKSLTKVLRRRIDSLGFAVSAILTRHEVHRVPYLQ